MPRMQQVLSLKGACLSNIAQNMDSLWCADYAENFLDQGNFVHVIGPFELVPPHLIQAILETLSKMSLLKRQHLHLLLNDNMKELNLSSLRPVSNTNAIVRLVNWRCTNLTALNLEGCKQVSAQVLCEAAESFLNIRKLNVSSTKCSDQVLTILAHRCYELRELKVSGCPVTDMGIVNLCVSFPRDTQKCPKLIRLDINDTMVGLKGVTEALANVPTLQWLAHPLLCIAVAHLNRDFVRHGGNIPTDKQYRLLNFQLLPAGNVWLDNVEECVATTCALCPRITSVKMMCSTSQVVASLCKLSNLTSLELLEEDSADFETDVLTLLKLRGSNLTSLHFGEINRIDLQVIGLTCPDLRYLALTYNQLPSTFLGNSHYSLVSHSSRPPFQKLEELKIQLLEDSTLPTESLVTVLVNAVNLKDIVLVGVQTMTDEVMNKMLSQNPLEHLKKFGLIDCNKISGDAIFPLLELPANKVLSQIHLLNCREITRAHCDDYISVNERKNFLIEIIWS